MKIIDTHLHLWDLERFSYSWCAEEEEAGLNRSFFLKDYSEAVGGVGLIKSVFVEADVDEPYQLEETKYYLALSEQENVIEGVVACGRPESRDFSSYLDQIKYHPKLKGIRRVIHNRADNLMTNSIFIENIRLLEREQLSFDLCALPSQLPDVIGLINECPGVSFILDHCGIPQIREKKLDSWQGQISEIASLPNVVCKISGLVFKANSNDSMAKEVGPVVDHVISSFGWDRVIFGSDWPICNLSASFGQWVEMLLSLTRGAGESNLNKLFYENAERIYRLS